MSEATIDARKPPIPLGNYATLSGSNEAWGLHDPWAALRFAHGDCRPAFQAGALQGKAVQAEALRPETLQAEVVQAEALQGDAARAEALQDDAIRAVALQAESLPDSSRWQVRHRRAPPPDRIDPKPQRP